MQELNSILNTEVEITKLCQNAVREETEKVCNVRVILRNIKNWAMAQLERYFSYKHEDLISDLQLHVK